MSKQVFIVAAKRTPFGTFQGKLSHLSATDLGGLASKAAVEQLPKGTPIDSTIYGNVLQTSADAAYLSRHVGHHANVPITSPALTINRLCGSGFQSVINAAQEILLGEANIVLAGGTESMSQAPYALRNVRKGTKYGIDLNLEDTLAHALVDAFPTKIPMGITAENLSKIYKVNRKDCDEFALSSQLKFSKGLEAGHYKDEIVPIEIKTRKGVETFSVDEHPRPLTTLESLNKLKPSFDKNGVVTAGNASGICDGAASLIVASEEAVNKYGLKPLARIVEWNYTGVEPSIMGIGPVPAIKNVLKRSGLSLNQIDSFEINEAFAAQVLSVQKELKFDLEQLNRDGGAIAIGHPLGASGARILSHIVYTLIRENGRYGLGSACIGGGQGIAVLLERV